jgi:DNA-3-methyladenine glycosylase I
MTVRATKPAAGSKPTSKRKSVSPRKSTVADESGPRGCGWVEANPLFHAYHDEVWGVPSHDDRILFEFLVLSGAQAGLSWSTILGKRAAYQRAFDGFDPVRVARYGDAKTRKLLADAGIVRNGQKIRSAIQNARATVRVQREFGSLAVYLWSFVGGEPVVHRRRSIGDIPSRSPESDALSDDLKARGFSFVGTTICYAFMQTVGMVNDHLHTCHRCPAPSAAKAKSNSKRNPTRTRP